MILELNAWHVPALKMYDGVSFNQDFVFTDQSKRLYRHDCVLLQFTGRFDQLGSKIWVGDVLRLDMTQTPEDIETGEEEYTAYYWVGFYNGGFVKYPMRCREGDPPTGEATAVTSLNTCVRTYPIPAYQACMKNLNC